MCLPLFVIAYSSMKLPANFLSEPDWQRNIQNMRLFSLVASFTFPFVVFLIRGGTNNYFVLCTIVAIYSILRLLTSCSLMARLLALFYREEVLAKEAKIAIGFIYLSISVAAAYIFIVAARPGWLNEILNRGYLGIIIKVSMLIVIVFPLLLPVTLLFRLKVLVSQNTKEKLRKY